MAPVIFAQEQQPVVQEDVSVHTYKSQSSVAAGESNQFIDWGLVNEAAGDDKNFFDQPARLVYPSITAADKFLLAKAQTFDEKLKEGQG